MSLDGKNKKALCKKNSYIGSALNFIEFIEGNWYEYIIETSYMFGTNIYYVDGCPMTERSFRDIFDDLQQRREDRLNLILN